MFSSQQESKRSPHFSEDRRPGKSWSHAWYQLL